MLPLKVGDPVTVVYTLDRGGWVAKRYVQFVDEYGFDTHNSSNYYGPRDEGITWIRGHHENGSDDALALLAARILLT